MARWITVVLLLKSLIIQAQDPDSLFMKARELAFQKDYATASVIFREIYDTYPEYTDAAIFLARIEAWQGNYTAADSLLLDIAEEVRNKEWWQMYVSIAYWQQDEEAHSIRLNKALKLYEEDEFFQLHLVYQSLMKNQLKEALDLLEERDWIHNDAIRLKRQLSIRMARRYISLSGQFDRLSPGSRNRLFSQLEYGFGAGASQYLGRIIYADRLNMQGVQYEIEAYPVINQRWYLFAGASYSGSLLFPLFKTGLDVNWVPAHGFETALGFRYLDFRESQSWILTPSGTWYTGDWMVHVRGGYVLRRESQNNASISVQTTRFYSSIWHRLRLLAGAGSFIPQRYSIDEPLQDISYWLGGEYRFPVYHSHFIWFGLEFAWEQPDDGLDFFRRYTMQMGYMYQF